MVGEARLTAHGSGGALVPGAAAPGAGLGAPGAVIEAVAGVVPAGGVLATVESPELQPVKAAETDTTTARPVNTRLAGGPHIAKPYRHRIGAEMPPQPSTEPTGEGGVILQLPEFVRQPFSAAMSQSVLLPAFVALFGIVAALFLVGFASSAFAGADPSDVGDVIGDDDDYVEFILVREPDAGSPPRTAVPRPPPADPVESWQSLLDDAVARDEPIGFAHNGSRVDGGRRRRRMAPPRPPGSAPDGRHNGSARHPFTEGKAPRGHRYHTDPDDDPTSYGRHSSGT